MKTFRQLQQEISKWSHDNFGDQSPVNPLLGIIEELGECEDACEHNNPEHVIDAVGDTIIYMMDFCGRMGYDLESVVAQTPGEILAPTNTLKAVGKLSHGYLKLVQGIRTNEDRHSEIQQALKNIFINLYYVVQDYNTTIYDCTVMTWDKVVSKRDWNKNKENGE